MIVAFAQDMECTSLLGNDPLACAKGTVNVVSAIVDLVIIILIVIVMIVFIWQIIQYIYARTHAEKKNAIEIRPLVLSIIAITVLLGVWGFVAFLRGATIGQNESPSRRTPSITTGFEKNLAGDSRGAILGSVQVRQ